jgi:hypothetical protein
VAARLTSLLPRMVALVAILVLGSATLTFAAENQFLSPTPQTETPAAPALQRVPDVTGQAYVFAKGTLEEQGFAWRVVGGVAGYPANTVVSQTPAAGTQVVDTGAPTILVGLRRNGRYVQEGSPENSSPYRGTAIRLPSAPAAKPKAKPVAKPTPRPRPATRPAPRPKPVAKPTPRPKPVAKPTPRPAPAPKPKPPARPPAFVVANAPKEPLDEITLPQRARRLERWLAAHRRPSNASVRHWLYQHEWIVTGARFGWSGGAEALEILIHVDERAQRQWGIGAKSERIARRALVEVAAKSR